jgi:hypothetical protein
MKMNVNLAGEEFSLVSYNLCHIDGHGDYEIFPSKELALDMGAVKARLITMGYLVEGANEQIILAGKDHIDITVFPQGRIIIEQLVPDEPEVAMDMAVAFLGLKKS